jgi:UDP-N-acetylmuramyl pentapeptide synthase
VDQLTTAASQWLSTQPEHASILVKGSRFMRMEQVSRALQGQPAADEKGSH